jgi:hypothetical protein
MTAARSGYSMKMAMALKSRFTTASVAAVYSVITRSARSTSDTKIFGLPNVAPQFAR